MLTKTPTAQRPRSKRWDRGHALANRLKHDGARAGLAPELRTEAMLLLHRGLLTEAQVAVGIQIAEIYGEYERAIGAPRRSGSSPHYERVYGLREVLFSDGRAIRARQRRDELQAVFDGLPVGHKARLQATVEKLFVDNLPIAGAETPSIRPVLDRIAAAWKASARAAWKPLSDLGSPIIDNLDDARIEIAKLRDRITELRMENKELKAKLGRPKGSKKRSDRWYLGLGLVAEDLKPMKDWAIAEKLREEVPYKGKTDSLRQEISRARHHPALAKLKAQHPKADAATLIRTVLLK